ncbi:MAG: DUF4129 domain-containing protein [bacterium]
MKQRKEWPVLLLIGAGLFIFFCSISLRPYGRELLSVRMHPWLPVTGNTVASLPRHEQLEKSDCIRVHPKAALILQRDAVPPSLPAAKMERDRQILRAILARPEFQYNRLKKDPMRWTSRLMNRIFRLLEPIARFLGRLFGWRRNRLKMPAAWSGLSWLFSPWTIYTLMAALAIVMLILLARSGQSLFSGQEEGETLPDRHDLFSLPDRLKDSPGYWYEQADLLMKQGRTREAFRGLYLALLLGFHRLNYIDFQRCRTNWNYLAHFRGDQQTRALFQELTARFDLVWYGRCSLAPDDYERYQKAIKGVLDV